MTPRQAAAMARLSSFVNSYATMRGLDPEYVYSVHAGPDGGRSEHIRISDLRTLLAMVAPTPRSPRAMTPQKQAAAVLKAATQARCLDHWRTVNDPPCHPSDPEWNGCNLCVRRAGDAAAIRAAVDLVLPEESEPDWGAWFGHEIEIFSEHKRLRAELLAIADAMEGPSDAS